MVAGDAGYVGDLHVGAVPGRGWEVHGWCRSLADPATPCWVDILADDRLALTLRADLARPDLDTPCGFSGALPEAALPPEPELLVWARPHGGRRAFHQRLLVRPHLAPPPEPFEPETRAALAAASAALGRVVAQRAPGKTLRAGLAAMGTALHPPPAAAVAFLRAPAATLLLPFGADPGPALACLLAVADQAAACRAEIVAVDGGCGDALLLLPVRVANLRIAPGPLAASVRAARGEVVALLDPDRPPRPEGLAAVLQQAARGLLPPSGGIRAAGPRDALSRILA